MKPASKLTDEELFEEIRHQVNAARNKGGHDRKRTREISAEMGKRFKKAKPKP
jgi:hypothetical protein